MKSWRTIELFAGIGGVTGGFLDAGDFEPIFLNDVDQASKSTFIDNFQSLNFIYRSGNIKNISVNEVLEICDHKIDGILGCPPCQGFSPVGTRDWDDERNSLINEMLRFIRKIIPKFFVMENVPTLLKSDQYRNFFNFLQNDYLITSGILNAAEYGIPQLRRRAVVIGIRKDLKTQPSLPRPTHGGKGSVFDYYSGSFTQPWTRRGRFRLELQPDIVLPKVSLVRLRDAIGDLPSKPIAMDIQSYASNATTDYQRKMRRESNEVRNHIGWSHSSKMIKLLNSVSPGDAPSSQGTRARNTSYFSQAYSRLHPRGLARTITTNFHNPGSGRFTHYSEPRSLTIREALRIQGFPDNFVFDLSKITRVQAERMVGNAFPRLLAEKIARHLKNLLCSPEATLKNP